jgi:hypothetical protein
MYRRNRVQDEFPQDCLGRNEGNGLVFPAFWGWTSFGLLAGQPVPQAGSLLPDGKTSEFVMKRFYPDN